MYHQYMYGSFSPVTQPTNSSAGSCGPETRKRPASKPNGMLDTLSALLGKSGVQNPLSRFDTGDILLILILLFLLIEGDNPEPVITLGLILLLGLDDTQSALL